jgi:hypothetical protein
MALAEELADACIDALKRTHEKAGHNTLYQNGLVRLIDAITDRLSQSPDASLSTKDYESIERSVIQGDLERLGVAVKDVDAISKGLRDRFPVLTLDPHSQRWRPTRREEMRWATMRGGDELLLTRHVAARRAWLAHNYLCEFSEALPVLAMHASGNLTKNALQPLEGRWLMFRKLNSVRVTLIANELRDFDLTVPAAPDGYTANHLQPAPMLAYAVIKSYLQVSQYVVDKGVSAELVAMALRGSLREKTAASALRNPEAWASQIGRESAVLDREAQGGQLRLKPDGLVWYARVGLVDPVDVGRVLRGLRADAAAKRLREAFADLVQNCTNASDFLG